MDYLSLIEKEIEFIKKIPVSRVGDVVNSISRNMDEKSRVITSGMGKAGHIAHNFSTTLSSTGTPSFFLHPSEAQHGDLGIILPGDIIIVFSNSGKTREIQELIDLVHNLNYGNYIYAIVGKTNEKIQLSCADYIEFGPVEEICPLGLAPTTSTTCMSVISDLIVVGLMKHNNFTKLEYSKFHHAGYLGEKSRS
jgi:arabinose-5-phosphate isomerase